MKKRYYLPFILLLSVFAYSCNTTTKKQINKEEKTEVDSPFSPVLKKGIDEFIFYVEEKHKNNVKYDDDPVILYNTHFFQRKDTCYFYIASDYFYDANLVAGYTFLDANLIIFSGSLTDCYKVFLDQEKLIPFTGTIQGYLEYRENIDLIYEGNKRILKVISPDSLQIIYTGGVYMTDIEKMEE